jgi:predicted Zn-dependent protease with MMP-like domain
MNLELFQQLVDEIVEKLPKEFAKQIENVDIGVSEYPNPYQLEKIEMEHSDGKYLLGLYEGTPHTKRLNYTDQIPDKITIFLIPLLRISNSLESLRENVYSTVIHEIGHHFGLSETEIRKAEYKRKRKKSN